VKLDNASWMHFTKVVCRGKVGTLTTDNAGYIRRAKNNIKGDSSRRTGWAWTHAALSRFHTMALAIQRA